jgi:hypothetical protein
VAPAPPSAPTRTTERRTALSPSASHARRRLAPCTHRAAGPALVARDFARRRQAQLYVVAQILDVLEADRNPKQPRGDAARPQCRRIQLAMSR